MFPVSVALVVQVMVSFARKNAPNRVGMLKSLAAGHVVFRNVGPRVAVSAPPAEPDTVGIRNVPAALLVTVVAVAILVLVLPAVPSASVVTVAPSEVVTRPMRPVTITPPPATVNRVAVAVAGSARADFTTGVPA